MSTAIRGERERARWRERCGWAARRLVEREIEKEKGERKNRKRENMRKIEKKRKNYFIQFKSYITKHSTAAEELQKSTTANI